MICSTASMSFTVDSVGVRSGELDPFAVAAMKRWARDKAATARRPSTIWRSTSFDLHHLHVAEARRQALEMTRAMACEVEFWNTSIQA